MTDRDALIAQVLPEHRGWLIAVATSMLSPTHPDRDDLAAEGYIAMWRAAERFDETREVPIGAWMQMAARRRMLDVVSRRERYTGQTPRSQDEDRVYGTAKGRETRDRIRAHLREHPRATGREIALALGLAASTVSTQLKRLTIDEPDPGTVSLTAMLDESDFDLPTAGDALDALIAGYHDGRIAEALDELTPNQRRYVVARFWGGLATSELREMFGYDPAAVWRTAKERLRPLLADLIAA